MTAAAATTVALTATATQSAQAAPTQTTAQLKAQIDQLNSDAEKAINQYDAAESSQQALQKQVSLLQDQVARQQASVNAKSAALGAVASAQYRSGAIDPSVQLMLSADPTTYLNQASTQSQVAGNQAALLGELKTEQVSLNAEKATAESKLKALDATSKMLAASKASVQQKLAAAKAKLDSITAAQRAAITRADSASSGASTTPVNLGSSKAGDSVEAAAFAAAQTRLNLPYSWGATGPNSFDCSGLMEWAYAKAGVNIGRSTYDQINYGTPVSSTADLQVGDLVFFNNNSHVGMYAGGGMVLHAPHTGTVVKFEKMSYIGSIYAMRHI